MSYMRIGIVLSLIGVMALMCGCNTSGEQPQSGGVFYYGGSRHVIKQARMEWQGDVYDNDEQLVELVFSESTLNVTDAGVSGYGAMIKLQ